MQKRGISCLKKCLKNNIKKASVKFQEDLLYFQHFMLIFVSPAKQKRDICTAFPASSLSSAAA